MSSVDRARRLLDAGVARVVVGLGLIARVRAAVPGRLLLAGGGVRGPDDVVRLAEVGCDGALVATALLDGALASRTSFG